MQPLIRDASRAIRRYRSGSHWVKVSWESGCRSLSKLPRPLSFGFALPTPKAGSLQLALAPSCVGGSDVGNSPSVSWLPRVSGSARFWESLSLALT